LVNAERKISIFQLVAWQESATVPTLVIDTEERNLKQFTVSRDAYAFELAGGSASRVFGIVYENGVPRLAIEDSVRTKAVFSSDAEGITVNFYRNDTEKSTIVLAPK
jgi:hypothetical protein